MTANKSFHAGDSVVIDWIVRIDDALYDPDVQAVAVEAPIVSITWDPELENMVVVGGDLTEYDTIPINGEIHQKGTGDFGIIYVPSAHGWHRFIIAGWTGGEEVFSRTGTFYVSPTTLVLA